MNSKTRTILSHYGGAVLFTALAVLVRFLLDPVVGDFLPLATLYGAVAVAVWLGGYRPALLALVLGYLACDYLFVEPRSEVPHVDAQNLVGLTLYLFSCSFIIGFGQAMQAARGRADQQREALRESQENLQTLLDALPVGVFIAHDPDCRRITGNRAGYELMRVSPANNLSLTAPAGERQPTFRAFQNGTQIQPAGLPAQRAVRGEKVWQEEFDVVFDDGSSAKQLVSAVPLFDAEGRIRGAVGIILDVTKERMALEALRSSEERLRLALDSANMGSWDWNVTTGENNWSAKTRELFGMDAATPVTFDRLLSCLHPDDVPSRQISDETLATGEYKNEYRVVLPGGAVRWMAARGRLQRDGQNQPTRMLGVVSDITERKRMEEALRRQKEENERLLQTLPAVVWVAHDPECRTVTGNDCANRLLDLPLGTNVSAGLPAHEQRWGRLLHRDGREMIAQEMPLQRAIATGKDLQNIEFSVESRDGRTVHLLGNAAPLYDPEGRVRGAVASCLDITALKAADNRLRESEERLRQITDLIPFGAWTTDIHGNPTYLSPLFLDMVGQTLEEHRREWPDTIHPEDAPATVAKWREFVATCNEWSHEFRMRGKDGNYRNIFARGFPLRDAEGRVTAFVGINYDITEPRRQEEALRASEQRWRTMAEALPNLVWTDLPDGQCDWLSSQWGKYTGIPENELLGLRWLETVIHPDDRERTLACWQAACADKADYDLEYRIRRYDGEYHWFKTRGVPVRDGEGKIVYWFGTCTDIEDVKRLEAALREADHRKDEFLATLAHELRNPLAPICSALQVLRLSPSPQAAEQARKMMERQVAQTVRLVDDLLDVSRITRGNLKLKKERVELAAAVRDAVEACRPLIESCGHELNVALPTEPVCLDADATRLTQVFSNLLNNAAKYSNRGAHIDLTAQRQGNEVQVSVKDTGIGIPTEMLSKIFEPFTQLHRDEARSKSGLGIGLTLVKRLVEMHGGEIQPGSDGPGKGSEFVVRLPLLVTTVVCESCSSEASQPSVGPHLRILVVDDIDDVAQGHAMFLGILGHEARTASDGLEAVEAAEAFRPDLVLLDVGLPKIDGYETCRRIRRLPFGKEVVLVAVTGWGQEEDRRKSTEAGFDHHMVKPVDHAALAKLLQSLPVRSSMTVRDAAAH
jgi:PAS domain S-box-containing protein